MPSIVDGVIDRALQAAVSRARTDSPRARELLAALAGRSVTVEARGTPFRVTIESDGTVLRVAAPTRRRRRRGRRPHQRHAAVTAGIDASGSARS